MTKRKPQPDPQPELNLKKRKKDTEPTEKPSLGPTTPKRDKGKGKAIATDNTQTSSLKDGGEVDAGPPQTPQKEKRKRGTKPQTLAPTTLTPPTNNEVLAAYHENPPECYIINPKSGWVDNAKGLAAYLGFENIGDWRKWVMTQKGDGDKFGTYDILEGFRAIAEANYSKPQVGTKATKTNISRASIWEQLTNNAAEMKPQMSGNATLPPRAGLFNPGTKVYPIIIHITAMSMLIRLNTKVFHESHQLKTDGKPGYGDCPHSSEDLNRAFLLLKFHLRHKSDAKAKNNFYISGDNGPTTPARYFTKEQLATALEAEHAPDGDAEALHPMEQLALEEDDVPDLVAEGRLFETMEEDFDKGLQMIEDINSKDQVEPDPERAGVRAARPPLTKAMKRMLCQRLGRGVKVLNDRWLESEPDSATEDYFNRTLEFAEGAGAMGEAYSNSERDEAFWALMTKISKASAPTSDYATACRFLGVDLDDPVLHTEHTQTVTLKPWQVVGADWILRQESLPVRGGIVADACGTGKTIQMLTAIASAAIDFAHGAHNRPHVPVAFRPTLILCPSAVVDVWFTEMRKHVPMLKAYRWYEVADKQRHAHIHDATLPSKLSEFQAWLAKKCPVDEPESALVVVVSSYETFASRALDVTTAEGSKASPLWVGENDEPKGALMDLSKEYTTKLSGTFVRIVLDEGHKVKNPQTIASNMVRLLNPTLTWILTATPIMNRPTDYIGYLSLLWREDMSLEALDQGDDPKLLYTDDTIRPNNTPAYAADGPYDYAKFQLPLWRLDPYLFKKVLVGQSTERGALTAYEVLRSITELITLRRNMATIMDVEGEGLRIGSSIPRYSICTVEVDFPDERQLLAYQKRYTQLRKRPSKPRGGKDTPRKFLAPQSPGQTGSSHFGTHRRLSLLTLNPALDEVVNRISGSFAQDVERWYHLHQDFGMSLYFRATRPARDLPLYPDRYSFGLYLAKDSPKLQYMAGLVGRLCLDEDRRVLLYADLPLAQWNIEGLLKNIGFNVLSLRSSMDSGERAIVIDQFNNPNYPVDVLVTSLKASTFGLNLQNCCSDLIIMAVAENVNVIIQVLGRLHRLGQTRVQRIWIIVMANSYDNRLQWDQTMKAIGQFAGEAAVTVPEDEIEDSQSDLDHRQDTRKGTIIRTQCATMIRRLLGQRISRADRAWADKNDLKKPWSDEYIKEALKDQRRTEGGDESEDEDGLVADALRDTQSQHEDEDEDEDEGEREEDPRMDGDDGRRHEEHVETDDEDVQKFNEVETSSMSSLTTMFEDTPTPSPTSRLAVAPEAAVPAGPSRRLTRSNVKRMAARP